jgi:hypothetical protein
VEEFEVATSGGFWVAIGATLEPSSRAAIYAAFGSARAYVRAIFFVNYVFWRCNDQIWDIKKQPGKIHPLPAIRMKLLRDSIVRCLMHMPNLGYRSEQFLADSEDIINIAERACGRIMHAEADMSMYASSFLNPASLHYLEILENYWCAIRPYLMKYAKVAQLSPCSLAHEHVVV